MSSEIMLINKQAANQGLIQAKGNAQGDQSVDLGTNIDRVNDSIATVPYGLDISAPLSASGLVRSGQTIAVGIIVHSTSGGSIKLWNNNAGSGAVLLETIILPVGTHNLFGLFASTGVYATITGTITASVIYTDPTQQ